MRAVGGRGAHGSELRIERLRSSGVAGGLSRASGTQQTIKAVGGELQRSFVFGQGVGGTPEFEEHVGKHLARRDADRLAAVPVLVIGSGAQFLESIVWLSSSEGQPSLRFAKIGRLLRGCAITFLARALLALGDELSELLQGRLRGRNVAAARSANGACPERGVIPILAILGDGKRCRFFPAVQLESGTRGKIIAVAILPLFGGPHDVSGVLNHFARFGFLAALKIGVAQEIHSVGLIVRFREVHFHGVRTGGIRRNVRRDGILPQAAPHKNVRRHVQGMGRIGSDRSVAPGGFEPLRGQLGAVGCVNQVMRDAGMIGKLLKERVENGDGFFQVNHRVHVFLGQRDE